MVFLSTVAASAVSAFVHTIPTTQDVVSTFSSPTTALFATKQLTPRQLQFWEDVDEGLVGIEKFYEKQGQSMERIKTFCKRARGDLPEPEPHGSSRQCGDYLAARSHQTALNVP